MTVSLLCQVIVPDHSISVLAHPRRTIQVNDSSTTMQRVSLPILSLFQSHLYIWEVGWRMRKRRRRGKDMV